MREQGRVLHVLLANATTAPVAKGIFQPFLAR